MSTKINGHFTHRAGTQSGRGTASGAESLPACGHLFPSAEKGIDLAVEPYINKKEVARRMGRTTRGVDKMMRRGLIPYYKFGYRVAYRWSEIQNHLAQTCRVCRS